MGDCRRHCCFYACKVTLYKGVMQYLLIGKISVAFVLFNNDGALWKSSFHNAPYLCTINRHKRTDHNTKLLDYIKT